MKKVLFVMPSSQEMYSKTKVKVGVPERPSLTFATLAAPLIKDGHCVEILDLDTASDPSYELHRTMDNFAPDYVGINCSSPLYYKMKDIATSVKQHNPNTIVVSGGPHPSSFPEATLADSELDIVCVGEGDFTMREIVAGTDWNSIQGIWHKNNGTITVNPKREYISDLDQLPYPAWSLFDLKKYKTPHLSCRKNPVGTMETSRGCVFGCTYCNKNIFGRTFRVKSPQRIVDEMEYMLETGFKEIHITDDGFTTNLDRAKKVCDLISERGLKFPWNLYNGVRVDRVDRDFLDRARSSGCYAMTFGVETGDPAILANINKGTTLDKSRQTFAWAKETGIQTLAFFMIGLPGETEESINRTIEFAKELDADYAKASILLPLPGTPLYDTFDKEGYIKSKDWSLYNQHDPSEVYDHPNLDWETINHYYNLFYREYYIRPKFVWRQLKKDIFSRNIFYDVRDFLKTRW